MTRTYRTGATPGPVPAREPAKVIPIEVLQRHRLMEGHNGRRPASGGARPPGPSSTTDQAPTRVPGETRRPTWRGVGRVLMAVARVLYHLAGITAYAAVWTLTVPPLVVLLTAWTLFRITAALWWLWFILAALML